jgi:AraC family transcriptional regulator
MDRVVVGKLEPRFEMRRAFVIAGCSGHVRPGDQDAIMAIWQRFAPHIGSVPGQVGGMAAYGAISGSASGVDYLAGVEVTDVSRLPDGFTSVTMPAQNYAVFRHEGHVSKLFDTCTAIWRDWYPKSGMQHAQTAGAPQFFEFYSEEYDPPKGMGGIEVWVPVKD